MLSNEVRARLRPITRADLADAQAITASFGWPHRIEDWEFMLGLGRGWAARQDGALVGAGLCWTFGETAGALGLVCVARARQGHGLGRRLLERLLDALARRQVVLSATEAGVRLYEGLGFRACGLIRQQQGAAFQPRLMPLQPGQRIRPVGRSDPAKLAALDEAATGMDRRELIGALLDAGTGVVLDNDGTATGFAILRRFGMGQVIGPVVAPDAAGARALIGHFLAANPGQFMRIDVTEHSGFAPWLRKLGLADAGGAIRMVRGAETDRLRSFALASQAFG
jgi:GNAT superfamily N-acetyltransferase